MQHVAHRRSDEVMQLTARIAELENELAAEQARVIRLAELNTQKIDAALVSEIARKNTALASCPETASHLAKELDAAEAIIAARNAQLAEEIATTGKFCRRIMDAHKALKPFAAIGQWLFAGDLPDDTPMVLLEGINGGRGYLSRGHFKAAHTALNSDVADHGGDES